MLRKRGRYETSIRLLNTIRPLEDPTSSYIQGVRWQILARTHSGFGYEDAFRDAIERAEDIATNTKETIDTQYNQFNLVEVLQEKAQGYTMLWQPEKALEIYPRTDQLKPFRPLRELGSYTIIKAQAHTYSGDVEKGIDLAIRGVELAHRYGSRRHISRVQVMYERLQLTRLQKHPRVKDLKEVLLSVQ